MEGGGGSGGRCRGRRVGGDLGRGGGGRVRGSGAEEGGDDSVGDIVELGDGGSHAGCQVTILLLVPLGPDAAQAVEGHHADKQLLWRTAHTHTAGMREQEAAVMRSC